MAHMIGIKSPHSGVGHSLLERSGDFLERRSNSRLLHGPLLPVRLSAKSAFALTTRRRHRDIVCELRLVDGVATDLASLPDSAVEGGVFAPLAADPGVLRSVPSNLGANYQPPKVNNLPPRICTLRAFGKSPDGVITNEFDETMSGFCKSLAASIELKARIQDWEIFSGRLAMMVFASAVLLEAVTGNSVFEKLDPHKLLEIAGAFVISSLFAAGFAVAWSAKTRVAYTMSKGYETFLNALIDNVIDGLFFDDD